MELNILSLSDAAIYTPAFSGFLSPFLPRRSVAAARAAAAPRAAAVLSKPLPSSFPVSSFASPSVNSTFSSYVSLPQSNLKL